MSQIFANIAKAELDGAITDSATSLDVLNAANIPTLTGDEFFLATIFSPSGRYDTNVEVVKVTSISGATWTIVRAQEGTTGVSHSDGELIELRWTAGSVAAVTASVITGSKTLGTDDALTEQVVNSASAVTLTIPANSTTAFGVGTKISVLSIGAGSTTITGATGVSLNGTSAGSADLTSQYSAVVLTKVGTDAWVINGSHGSVS